MICSFLVVLIHQYNLNDTYGAFNIQKITEGMLCHGLCTAAVPIFFFISGFLFFRDVEKNDCQKVAKKLKRRVKTVLFPYLLWSTFYFLFYAVGNRVFGIEMRNAVDISFGGILYSILFHKYCYPLWFLFQLFIFNILSILIFYILKNQILSNVLLSAIVIFAFFDSDPLILNINNMNVSIIRLNFLAYYLFGCIASRYMFYSNIYNRIKQMHILLFGMLLIIFSFVCYLFFESVIPFVNKRVVVPVIALLTYGFIDKLFSIGKILPIADRIANNSSSMIIYVIHTFTGCVINKIGSLLNVNVVAGGGYPYSDIYAKSNSCFRYILFTCTAHEKIPEAII